MAAVQRNDQDRLKKLIAAQQSSLIVGVHYHPLPMPQTSTTQHGMIGCESASPVSTTGGRQSQGARSTRRPDTSPVAPSSAYDAQIQQLRPHSGARPASLAIGVASARDVLPMLRAKGHHEEAARAALGGQANHAALAVPETRSGQLSHATAQIVSPSQPRTSGAAAADVRCATTESHSARSAAVAEALASTPAIAGSPVVIPRPPLHRADMPIPQHLPSTTTHAVAPARSSAAALNDVRCANPFFVAHAPPAIDIATGEPVLAADSDSDAAHAHAHATPSSSPVAPSTSRPASGATPYRHSQALSTSRAAEYHESQREVLNLQLRGVAAHALRMRRTSADAAVDPVKIVAREAVDLCNGCTAALRSYEENYDWVYEVRAPDMARLADELKLKTPYAEVLRLSALPNMDPQSVRGALAELSAPVLEDPQADAFALLSASRLALCRRHIGKLDSLAGLSVADSVLRMYEILHTDMLTAPRELLAADEASLVLMQRDVEALYVRRVNLLDEVEHSTNRTVPLMADGPLSATGNISLASPSSFGARAGGGGDGMSPVSASREIAALLLADDESIRTEVQRQLMDATPGAVRVHTVEALSPPRRPHGARDLVTPEDTQEDTDGKKLAVAEATQRREVHTSRELLTRRTHRCEAMLDFVDGIRAFVADALGQQRLGKDITQKNAAFIARTIATAAADLDVVGAAIRKQKDADADAQERFRGEQREAHATLARMTAEEGELWAQVQALIDRAQAVGKERDALFLERLRETESESRRQKVHLATLDRLSTLSLQLTRMNRSMAKYEDAARETQAFHATFVEEALVPKLQQEEELITMRGAEALAFSTAFRNFAFSAEDLLGRLEVRGKALRQRQRSAGLDEAVAQQSLDVTGCDAYAGEVRRLAALIDDTERRKLEVSGWIHESREAARVFMPIAVAAREAAKLQQRPGSSAAAQRAVKIATAIQDDTFGAAADARADGLRNQDRAEAVLGRQRQTAEQQVEELRTEIRRMKRETDAHVRQSRTDGVEGTP